MYIRTRTRGTNQYQQKGELRDATFCPKCSRLVSTAELDMRGTFPIKKQIDKCSNCGAGFLQEK